MRRYYIYWILTLLSKPFMKCHNLFTKYTLLSDNPGMIKIRPLRLSTNICLTIVLVVILIVIDKLIGPVQRGFFCDDRSIMKPYVKDQTVPVYLLGSVTFILFLLVVVGVELFNKNSNKEKVVKEQEVGHVYIGNVRITPWVYRILSPMGFIIIGLTMSTIITDIGKKLVGRLRPHFLSVCLPNYKMFNCSDGYITGNVCTSSNRNILLEARLSFPSGHASISVFASVVLALYVEYKVQTKHFTVAKPFTQFVLISLGVCCSLTRISDYWHHWSDVLAGFLIGTLFAVYTIFGLMKLHNEKCENVRKGRFELSGDVESQSANTYVNEIE